MKQSNYDGNPKLWDEWLQIQIDYYKLKCEKLKSELNQNHLKKQLKQYKLTLYLQ